jgi:hypothetical protein
MELSQFIKELVVILFIAMFVIEVVFHLTVKGWNNLELSPKEIYNFNIHKENLIKARYSPKEDITESRWYEVDGIKFMIIKVNEETFIKLERDA